MPTEAEERIHFFKVKEGRAEYFVEYRAPISGWRFSTLQLVCNPLTIRTTRE